MMTIAIEILPSMNPLLALSDAIPIEPALSLFKFLSNAPVLAAASAADLMAKLKEVLNILMAFGFLYGTVRIIGGAMQIQRGETEAGKQSIIAGALIASAPMIMRVLFGIFVDGGAPL
ncbi:MAG: hypothetical protein JNN07_02830 [Verrucomicrobiales bacterium]|nr:hypothetical protein [Verrucomicrobiales bacterium]